MSNLGNRAVSRRIVLGGIDRVSLMMSGGALPHAKLMHAIELMGTKIKPILEEALPATAA